MGVRKRKGHINYALVCRNAGGVFNHRFYFAGMTPDGSRRLPCGALQSAVLQTFGTQAAFEDAFTKALEATTHYDMDGPMLLLLGDGELKAVFQAKP